MSYLVLARKYRPKDFSELVGQEHIAQVLKNSIETNRIAHAYIFAGPHGTGKTTTARIFAKALNCTNGPTPTPCKNCTNCLEIAAGNSIDVLEIDGASNRGIDEIRALRENVKFTPASSKYKIYIIDESHQITDAAFNALLKTLEEPPEHVIFILATTAPEKIPLTILSRCQRFRFRPLTSDEILVELEKISKAEKFKIEKSALKLLAHTAAGSLRDALSLLDQIVSFSPDEKVTENIVREFFGLTPIELISSFVELVAKKDVSELLKKISIIAQEGYDFGIVAQDLREYFRKLIFVNYIEENLSDLYLPEETEMLKNHKMLFTTELLLRNSHLINKCIEEIRWSDNPRLIFELYTLKLAQDSPLIETLVDEIEQIEKKLNASAPTISTNIVPAEQTTHPTPSVTPIPATTRATSTFVTTHTTSTAAPTIPNPAAEPFSALGVLKDANAFELTWQKVIEEIKKRKPILSELLRTHCQKKISVNELQLFLPEGLYFDKVNQNLDLINSIVEKFFGQGIKAICKNLSQEPTVQFASSEEEVEISEKEPTVESTSNDEVYEIMDEKEKEIGEKTVTTDSAIKKLLDSFDGKIVKRHEHF
ncbi:MAG: DNA polymerase III subunit gamma/tau [Elusimicrobiota bacterium]|nr:DNA polymerase III subunit gamma/tau [Elusimicrobiota bacterium]